MGCKSFFQKNKFIRGDRKMIGKVKAIWYKLLFSPGKD